MFKFKSLAAVAFAVAASSSAFATTVVLAPSGGGIYAGDFSGNATGDNVFSLDLSAVPAGATDFFADVTANFSGSQYFKVTSVKFDNTAFTPDPGNGVPSGSNFGQLYFTFAGVVNPTIAHSITVSGTSFNSSGFTGTVSFATSPVPPAPPVPEPETYAMMLAGLGALGFLARRRKNA